MKILVLNYEYPPLGGGAGVITKHIAEELAALGHEITVVTTWFKGLKQVEDNGGLKIFRLKSKRKFTYRSGVFEMRSWMRHSKSFLTQYCIDNSFDLCFANFALPGGEVALYLKKRFDIPYTIISHGHDIPWFFGKEMFWYHFATYFWIKTICKNSFINFMLSQDMKDNIDRFLGEKNEGKNVIISNGCDTGIFKPDHSKKSTLFKIIFVGRLVNQKDPFTFLKALKLLSDHNIPFVANIIGDGVLRKEMEKYVAENSLHDKINFMGWLAKDKILKEYQSSHVFVQSSLYEAMSVAIMEALACGNYAISTHSGLSPTLITPGENGELFSTNNPDDLAEKLTSYYDFKFKENFKIKDSLIEKIHLEYNWKKIALKYEQLFRACAETQF